MRNSIPLSTVGLSKVPKICIVVFPAGGTHDGDNFSFWMCKSTPLKHEVDRNIYKFLACIIWDYFHKETKILMIKNGTPIILLWQTINFS
jgi:hypothetical protein